MASRHIRLKCLRSFPDSGLPALPQVDISLHVSKTRAVEAVSVFADYLSQSLKNC
ncbi:MAG: hypothetical protein U5L07_07185 [Desulfobacterales bacterium]|nr:hypothetical protein [Desulfobacterales bacterium]